MKAERVPRDDHVIILTLTPEEAYDLKSLFGGMSRDEYINIAQKSSTFTFSERVKNTFDDVYFTLSRIRI